MFERWSEHRRRWFLLTFSGAAWALFLSALAQLGPHYSRGGIGSDATHAASIFGTFAVWTLVWSAFHLRLRHWAYAVLLGFSLNAALVDFGVRDHAAAGVWSIACDVGEAQACNALADFYAAGRSPVHGWLDADRLQRRAHALSGHAQLRREDVVADEESCLVGHSRVACVASGEALASSGRQAEAAQRFALACQSTLPGDSLDACDEVLDSGFHDLRIQACDVIERTCPFSSDVHCPNAQARCERVRSPHAGVN